MVPTTDYPVVLYARVSQARDDRSKSVDDQLAELHRWAKRERWTIAAEYRDDDISASRYAQGKTRPGWEKALRTVRSGKVRALLTWEFSRTTRDMSVFTELETTCRDHGVKLGYSGRLLDLGTAEGGFSAGLDALLAARESAMTSERVQRAVDARASRGRPHGTVPYGYRRVIDPDSGLVTGRDIDPETGPVVQEVVTRLLNRETAHAIATDLNRRGILTTNGRPWRGGNLRKLALRPTYAGLRTHHGKVLDDVTATWPPIITVEQHHQLRALFGSPERDKYRNSTDVKHLGTGLFRCGRCGGRMRVHVNGNQPNSYTCRDCFRVSRQQAKVDELVERVIIDVLSRPDAADLLTDTDDDQRVEARAEVARLHAEMADAQNELRAGRLSPTDMAAYREGWAPRLQQAEHTAQPAAMPQSVADMFGPDAAGRWASADIATRRAIVDTLLTVTILPVGRSRPFSPDSVRIEGKA